MINFIIDILWATFSTKFQVICQSPIDEWPYSAGPKGSFHKRQKFAVPSWVFLVVWCFLFSHRGRLLSNLVILVKNGEDPVRPAAIGSVSSGPSESTGSWKPRVVCNKSVKLTRLWPLQHSLVRLLLRPRRGKYPAIYTFIRILSFTYFVLGF